MAVVFSRPVSGLTASDFELTHVTMSSLASNDGGHTWNAELTPLPGIQGADTVIRLGNAHYASLSGNAGEGISISNSFAVDTVAPTAQISVGSTHLGPGNTATVTVTFSEPVSALEPTDFVADSGSLSAFNTADGGITWTGHLTPAANTAVVGNVVTLIAGRTHDEAGNALECSAIATLTTARQMVRPTGRIMQLITRVLN